MNLLFLVLKLLTFKVATDKLPEVGAIKATARQRGVLSAAWMTCRAAVDFKMAADSVVTVS